MGKALNDKKEMQLIYKVARDVYSGEYSSIYGVLSLKGKCSATQSSIKMYFEIYKCMRLGKCYKMGTSEKFTRFLLNAIFRDEGIEEYKKALSAVKGNSAYRDSVNNSQPGLLRACLSSIEDCGADIDYESIPTASILSMEETME